MNIKLKIILIFISIIFLLSILSYQFLNSDISSTIARNFLIETINSKFNIKSDIDHIEFGYFPPSATLKNIRLFYSESDNTPFFETKILKVSLRTFQLMLGDVRLETIFADTPSLYLDLAKLKKDETLKTYSSDMSFFEKLKKFQSQFEFKYINLKFKGVHIINGNFNIKNSTSGIIMDIKNLNVNYKTSFFIKDNLFGTIETFQYQNNKTETSHTKYINDFKVDTVKFNIGMSQDRIKLYDISFNAFSQPVKIIDGTVKNIFSNPTFDFNYKSRISLNSLFFHHHIPGSYTGGISIDGTLSGSQKHLKSNGKIESSKLNLNSFVVGKTLMDFVFENGQMTLPHFEIDLNDGSISGNLRFKMSENFELSGKVSTNNVKLEHILYDLGIKGAHVSLPINSSTEISGQLANPFTINLNSDFAFEKLDVFDEAWNNENKKLIFHLPAGTLKAQYFITPKSLNVNQCLITLEGTPTVAEIEARFPFNNSMTLSGDIKSFDISKIKLLDLKLKGILDGRISMDGKFSNLSLHLPFYLARGKINNYNLLNTSGEAKWFGKNLFFKNLVVKDEKNHLTGNLQINLGKTTYYSLEANLKNLSIDSLSKSLPIDPQGFKKILTHTTGNLSGKIIYEHDLKKHAEIDLIGKNITYHNYITDLELVLNSSIKNDILKVSSAKLSKEKSIIDLNGQYDIKSQHLSGSLIGDIHSNDFIFFKDKWGLTSAYLDLFSEFSGSIHNPDVNVKIAMSPFFIFNEQIGDSLVNVTYNNGFLSYGNLFNNNLSFVLSETDDRYDLDLNFNKFNFGKILSMYLNNRIQRPVNMDFFLSSNGKFFINKPVDRFFLSSSSGKMLIHELLLVSNKFELTNPEPFNMALVNGIIDLSSLKLFDIKDDKNFISLKLNHSDKKSINLQGLGNLEIGIFQPLFDRTDINLDSGRIDFKLSSYNTGQSTQKLSTEINFIDTKAGIYDSAINLSSINGRVNITNQNILIDSFKGKIGIGDFTLGGTIDLLSIPRLNLNLNIINGQVNYKNILTGLFDANLNILGNIQPYLISGNILSNRLTYNETINWKTMMMRRRSRHFLPDKTEDKPLFNFNVLLQGRDNISVTNNLADIGFNVNLLLVGSSENPILKGDIDAIKGLFFYQGNTFNINSLHLSFTDSLRINPQYSIVAQANVKNRRFSASLPNISSYYQIVENYKVTISTSGYLNTVASNVVTMTSEPPLSPLDLAQLLTFGTITPIDEEQKQAEQLGRAALYDIVSGQLQEAIERETRDYIQGLSLNIKPRFSGDDKTLAPIVTLEKNISDRLSVRGSKVLDDTIGEQELKLELKLTPHLSITSGMEESKNQFNETIDFELAFPFGR